MSQKRRGKMSHPSVLGCAPALVPELLPDTGAARPILDPWLRPVGAEARCTDGSRTCCCAARATLHHLSTPSHHPILLPNASPSLSPPATSFSPCPTPTSRIIAVQRLRQRRLVRTRCDSARTRGTGSTRRGHYRILGPLTQPDRFDPVVLARFCREG